MILISSLLLAAYVIASAVFKIVVGKSTSAIAISVVVVLVSILSVVFIYRAKVISGSAEKTLNERYFHEYELIRAAIMNSPLSPSTKKSISEDVLELLLTSQSNGKTVQAAIGNTESFAREIISAYISKTAFNRCGYFGWRYCVHTLPAADHDTASKALQPLVLQMNSL